MDKKTVVIILALGIAAFWFWSRKTGTNIMDGIQIEGNITPNEQ